MAFLNRCRSLIKPGGVLVLVSPYSWLKGWTDKTKWLGGYYEVGGLYIPAQTKPNQVKLAEHRQRR